MGRTIHHSAAAARAVWALVARQHGVIARWQLLELGFTRNAIEHRIASGRLFPVRRGVYAVGRPQLSREGVWMAALLSCGPRAVLSHQSAAALWGIRESRSGVIYVSVLAPTIRRRPGIRVHRRPTLGEHEHAVTRRDGIPVTTPVLTLVDLATRLDRAGLEAAINQADQLELVDPETLRRDLERFAGYPGVRALRETLDRRTFALTDSEAERIFLRIARKARLPLPQTRQWINGFKVDFYWPDLGLVVETDGLRYHRTPAQQARDRLRDQAHAAAGLTTLRFTRAQLRYEPNHVEETLAAVATRLRGSE